MNAPRTIARLLLVEDNAGDARLLREMFREQQAYGTQLIHVESLAEAEAQLAHETFDLVLIDLGLPDAQGLEAVRRVRAAAPRVSLVVLSGLDDESVATHALQEGAQDYLVKGHLDGRGLLRALRYAMERKALEQALFVERGRAQASLNCIGDAVACTDTAGDITFLNTAAERLTGWSSTEAIGSPISSVFNILDATSREVLLRPDGIAHDVRTTPLPANCLLVRRDGLEIPIEDSIAPIRGADGEVLGSVVVFRDVTAARDMALQMAYAAHHDFLTGLPNRMLLNDRLTLAMALANRHGRRGAILLLDLDGFKRINDTLGHAVGDRLLQSVAWRLLDCVRSSDTVSRQGGDEFVVLLSEVTQAEDAAIAARRMLRAVGLAHVIDEHRLEVTTSIGVSVFPDDGTDPAGIIKNADAAMYLAKEGGRQGYRFSNPAIDALAATRNANQ